ncbi:hypothetical protein CH63R_13052 [Colletotrichum higginsianum IMI 349063]|uniref:Uncharacterized protein n=1 Tax=Colletotrichum higginsianum (strain IMI 349063) TaxID=759273 RepID=A0A1B7XW03_COLHI|nr:hypothetical protein CH63R_13052 [Colletotrichum higginsianum IMI 349063]OBR03925.1 hypothetical protein CH63R_13052 [Colletotrichum higginsianum IMI 349063]
MLLPNTCYDINIRSTKNYKDLLINFSVTNRPDCPTLARNLDEGAGQFTACSPARGGDTLGASTLSTLYVTNAFRTRIYGQTRLVNSLSLSLSSDYDFVQVSTSSESMLLALSLANGFYVPSRTLDLGANDTKTRAFGTLIGNGTGYQPDDEQDCRLAATVWHPPQAKQKHHQESPVSKRVNPCGMKPRFLLPSASRSARLADNAGIVFGLDSGVGAVTDGSSFCLRELGSTIAPGAESCGNIAVAVDIENDVVGKETIYPE